MRMRAREHCRQNSIRAPEWARESNFFDSLRKHHNTSHRRPMQTVKMFSTNMLASASTNADPNQVSSSSAATFLAAFNGQLQQQQQEALTNLFRSLSSLAANNDPLLPTSSAPSTSGPLPSSIQSVVAAALMQQQLATAPMNQGNQSTEPTLQAQSSAPTPLQAYHTTPAPLDLAQPLSSQTTAQSTSLGSPLFNEPQSQQRINYCTICNKELCNKYFMKTHMLKMHGINLEIEQSAEKSDAEQSTPLINEMAGNSMGGVVCDICNKELCSKYFLKVHKQNTHGIITDYQDAGQFVYPFGKQLSVQNPFMSSMSVGPLDMTTAQLCFGAMNPFSPAALSPTMIVDMILKNQNLFTRKSLQALQNPKKTSKIGKDKGGNIESSKQKGATSKNSKDKNGNRYLTQYTEGCPMCDRRFKSIKWLKTHMMNDHKQEIGAYMQMMMQQLYPVKSQPMASMGTSPMIPQRTCFPFNIDQQRQQQNQQLQQLQQQQQQQQQQQLQQSTHQSFHQQEDNDLERRLWPASCLPVSSAAQFNIAALSEEFFGKETEGAPSAGNLHRLEARNDLEGAPSGSNSLA